MNTSLRFSDQDRGPDGKLIAPVIASDAAPNTTPTPPPARRRAVIAPVNQSPQKRRTMAAIASGVVAAIALILLTMRSAPTGPMVAQHMEPEIAPRAASAATPPPAPTLPPTVVPVAMLPAFAAPSGAPLGQIEATRAITPVAHFGADWIQADVKGSGKIWLRSSDFPQLAIVGPDLAPKAAPAAFEPPASAPDSAADVGNVTPTNAPPAAEVPTTGTKPADDRAAAHALAVARSQQQHDSGHGTK